MTIMIYNDDNLTVLQRLADAGERFDLIELDGPYGAGLEGWDCLTEDEYIAHYTARLPLVARCLQPWGVSFLFGYPEGCAEIKAWARQTGALHLRRWLTWYKQVTAHKGRKCESILVFTQQAENTLAGELKQWLRSTRRSMGLTITQAMALTPSKAHLSGKGCGMMWYEALSSSVPTAPEYYELKQIFGVPDYFDYLLAFRSFDEITNLDYIGRHYSEDSRDLNNAGLRSKPVGLYLDLFRPTVPPRQTKRALILYGGSGNAAIAAGQLGYDVTVCETDPTRCEYIRRRWAWKVERRDETPIEELGPLFTMEQTHV